MRGGAAKPESRQGDCWEGGSSESVRRQVRGPGCESQERCGYIPPSHTLTRLAPRAAKRSPEATGSQTHTYKFFPFSSVRLLPVLQSLQSLTLTPPPPPPPPPFVNEHTAMGRSLQTPERTPSLRYRVLPPRAFPFLHLHRSHQALGQRAPGGAGAGRVSSGASPKGGVEQRRGQICDRGAYCTVEKPVGTLHCRALVLSWPGPARPRAMEFLWAPLLGLCCSLAAADRHIVFWNSSNPK